MCKTSSYLLTYSLTALFVSSDILLLFGCGILFMRLQSTVGLIDPQKSGGDCKPRSPRVYTHFKHHLRSLKILQSVSELGGLWKQRERSESVQKQKTALFKRDRSISQELQYFFVFIHPLASPFIAMTKAFMPKNYTLYFFF